MQIVVNDILTEYTDNGSGPVLVCVHGWMHDTGAFKELSNELSKNYRVIALDLPNFGKSQITSDVITLDNYAAFLDAFVKKLKIKDYTYIGHSMGGQIAMRGVAIKAITPSQLILIGSAGVRDTRKLNKAFLKLMSGVFRHITPKRLKARFYSAIGSDYTPDLSDVHKKIIAQTLKDDVQEDAKLVSIPTLLIYGSEDSSTPLWMAKILQSHIKGSTLEIIDGENHWPQQTASDKVATVIKRFLA